MKCVGEKIWPNNNSKLHDNGNLLPHYLCTTAHFSLATLYRMGQKIGQVCLKVNNFATVTSRKACDMSKVMFKQVQFFGPQRTTAKENPDSLQQLNKK